MNDKAAINDMTAGFWALACKYGRSRLLWCTESLFAILTGLACLVAATRGAMPMDADSIREFTETLLAVSATLLGMVMAGFSITVALLDTGLLALIRKQGTLSNMLFPFWWIAASWVVSILSQGITWVMAGTGHGRSILLALLTIEVSLLAYSLFGSLWIVRTVLRFAFARGEMATTVCGKCENNSRSVNDTTCLG